MVAKLGFLSQQEDATTYAATLATLQNTNEYSETEVNAAKNELDDYYESSVEAEDDAHAIEKASDIIEESGEEIPKTALESMKIMMAYFHDKHGLNKRKLGMESVSYKTNRVVALEGFKEFVQNIWQAILNGFAHVKRWFGQLFEWLLALFSRNKAKADAVEAKAGEVGKEVETVAREVSQKTTMSYEQYIKFITEEHSDGIGLNRRKGDNFKYLITPTKKGNCKFEDIVKDCVTSVTLVQSEIIEKWCHEASIRAMSREITKCLGEIGKKETTLNNPTLLSRYIYPCSNKVPNVENTHC